MLIAKRARVPKGFWYWLVIIILKPWLQLFTKRDWRNAEKLPREGGVIVCSNHISNFDFATLGHFLHDNGRPPRFLAKSELFKFRVIGAWLRSTGQIPVYRGTSQAATALRDAETALAAGECVVIYPEGTLTRDPNLWPMTGLTGTARLALETKVPVIPIAQWGAHLVIPNSGRGFFIFAGHTIKVQAGDPVYLADLFDKPLDAPILAEATNRIMWAVTSELALLREEPAPTALFDRRIRNEKDVP